VNQLELCLPISTFMDILVLVRPFSVREVIRKYREIRISRDFIHLHSRVNVERTPNVDELELNADTTI
jgi:hypothetical protein